MDVVVSFIAGESAAGLTLGEAHRTPRISEITVSGTLN
jgi:hypothetical protein